MENKILYMIGNSVEAVYKYVKQKYSDIYDLYIHKISLYAYQVEINCQPRLQYCRVEASPKARTAKYYNLINNLANNNTYRY